jgi:UDP-N-acetylglucosamine--N-acetylmuramyl-(pentapeptide) pyrophosphoryl-undecaprenol N-acetylglucosamine transferase
MRVMFAGGGTAGHINPAIAIAKQIKATMPKSEILFVGTKNGMEQSLVPKSGFPIEYIHITGFVRRLSFENVKTVGRFIAAVHRCKKLIRGFSPDVVVGTGGFVSGPLLYAAHRLKIPCVIQEQNAIPGMTNKFLSRFSDLVFTSFAETAQYVRYPKKIRLTGNPIRQEFSETDYKSARRHLGIQDDEFFVFCSSGSLGALRINQVMSEFVEKIKGNPKIRFVMGTGERYYDQTMQRIQSVPQNVSIERYIHNMGEMMHAADLVVARSGAITVSELTAIGKPSILVPSPNVTGNHQYYNALALQKAGAAVLIPEKELTVGKIYQTVLALMEHPERLKQMRENCKALAHLDAAESIAKEIFALAKAKGKA